LVTNLIVADDHPLVREGLRRILEARKDLRVIAEACDGEEAARLVVEHKPDIALIDLTMPRMSGVSAIRRITKETATRCIVVSVHEEFGFFTQAVEAGAAAYVVKRARPSELFDAIDAVRSGGSYLSPSISHWAVEAIAHPSARLGARRPRLTAREHEVLEMIADGLSTKEIAAALHVSSKTVEAHRAKLMAKLKVHRASGLVRVALQEGLITF
jgi:DNA-binding NarL/FixJ family response regulator